MDVAIAAPHPPLFILSQAPNNLHLTFFVLAPLARARTRSMTSRPWIFGMTMSTVMASGFSTSTSGLASRTS